MFRLKPRLLPSVAMVCLAPVLAILLTLVAGAVLFMLLGIPVGEAFHAFFVEPVSTRWPSLHSRAHHW